MYLNWSLRWPGHIWKLNKPPKMGCDLFCEMLFHMYLLASATKKKNRTKKIFTTHETNIQGGNQITLNTGTLFSFHPVSLKAIFLRFEFRQFRIKQDTSVFHKTSLSHFRPILCYNKYPIVSWDVALCKQICLTPTSYPSTSIFGMNEMNALNRSIVSTLYTICAT